MRLLSLWFWKDLSFYPITKCVGNTLLGVDFSFLSPRKSPRNENSIADKNVGVNSEMSLLDLPDLVLECILEKLPPEGLCRMASVCTSLKDRCLCNHLWEKHMNKKWGRIVGSYAYREWQSYVATRKGSLLFNHGKQKGLMDNIIHLWHFMFIKPSFSKQSDLTPVDSIMSWYLALESGNFWFPAQVYNRENGHVGFVLSCYDAMLSYDKRTDTFLARYPAHGTRHCAVESGVTWDRIRAPRVDTFPHNLHISDCLHDLHPGDQMEIQWRRNKEFPYGWWYGIVGHLETCDGDANYCSCRDSDTVVLEFKQYTHGSRWRRTIVNRKDHREEGNEVDGFYGGIRKLRGEEEISSWNKLWPAQVLE